MNVNSSLSHKKQEPEKKVLYIVGTPIGNLYDISSRAIKILKGVSLIACEDTRRTKKLMAKYEISNQVISFNKENSFKKSPQLIRDIKEGKSIALVSDAGMPGICDPGEELVREARIKRSMWSRRAQEYESKISSGKIYELAEVVRDLNKGDDLMVDQSYSERQLFEKAYERILSEFQIILNLSLEDTQKKLDKALKRNLENKNKITTQETENPNPKLPVEETISETEEPLED